MKLLISLFIGYLICASSPLQKIFDRLFLKGFISYNYNGIIIGIAIVMILYSIFLKTSNKKPVDNTNYKYFTSLIYISIIGNIASYIFLYMLVDNIKYASYINIIYIVITCSMLAICGLWVYQTIHIGKMCKFAPMFILYAISITISGQIYFFIETLNYEVVYYQIRNLNLFVICGMIVLVILLLIFGVLDKKYFVNLKH